MRYYVECRVEVKEAVQGWGKCSASLTQGQEVEFTEDLGQGFTSMELCLLCGLWELAFQPARAD